MSNRFRPAWLLVLAALSTSALAKAPETVNIGYQKANILALLKYRGTLDESLKKQGIAVRWVEFPAGPQMLEGLNVGSIDLAATGDAPPAFAQAAQLLEPQVSLLKLNTEAHPASASSYQIRSIPTMILFQHGRELARLSGALPASEIVRWVRSVQA